MRRVLLWPSLSITLMSTGTAKFAVAYASSAVRSSKSCSSRFLQPASNSARMSRFRAQRYIHDSARALFAISMGGSMGAGAYDDTKESSRGIDHGTTRRLCSNFVASTSRKLTRGSSFAGGALGFRRVSCEGSGPLPAALEAWPWKNPQGLLISPLDRREYRWLVLPNGLQVMVISDPLAEKAAAAMAVNVGAASDPPELPGLAHFLEHMLFLGTAKFPVENAYRKYLSKYGGRSNASTSMDDTTFKFEVGADHLKGALDIFAQFFVSPLFSEGSTDRELLAVDSEDSKNRTNDARRILQVLKALADPDHPYAKFSTGNIKTLREEVPQGVDMRTELLAFHDKHYHALNMALVVLGKESLDELEGWAREYFTEVKGQESQTSAGIATDHVFAGRREEKGVSRALKELTRSPWTTVPPAIVVDFEPLRSIRSLALQWPMPPIRRLWRNSPTRIISHFMGHEGPGSLFAILQDRGLATSLSSGLRTSHDDFSLFQVEVALTKDGQRQWEEVARLVHEHARLVRNLPPDAAKRAWEEDRDMSAIHLRFQQELSPYVTASSLARRLQLYPSNEAISAGGVLDPEIDQELFAAFADYLRPDNTITWRLWRTDLTHEDGHAEGHVDDESPHAAGHAFDVETDEGLKREKWYGVNYKAYATPQRLLDLWSGQEGEVDSALRLPGPNIFIPDDFSLVCDREKSVDPDTDATPGASSVSLEPLIINGQTGVEAAERQKNDVRTPSAVERPGVVKAPDLLVSDESGQLWHSLDSYFRQPRAYVRVVLATPVVSDGGGGAAEHANILADILSKILAQRTYDARLAGLSWKVGPHPCGFVVQASGFSQKIESLLGQILEAFLDPVAAAGGPEEFSRQFDLAQERAIRRCKNWSLSRPDDVAGYLCSKALDSVHPVGQKSLDPGNVEAAKACSLEGCLRLHEEALSRVKPMGLVYGNASQDDARRIWQMMIDKLKEAGCDWLPESSYPRSLVGILPEHKLVNLRVDVPNQEDENSAFLAFWQIGERDERKFATLVLLSQLMREPCFSELRTKQQIGYVVASGLRNHGRGSRQLGFSVRALSKSFGPDEVRQRVDDFLPHFREILVKMPQEDYDMHVSSMIRRQLEPPKQADAMYSFLMNEIFMGNLLWDRSAKMAELLQSISREEVLSLLDSQILDKDNAKRMNVMVYGKSHPRPQDVQEDDRTVELKIDDVHEFRSSLKVQDTTVTPQEAIEGAESRKMSV